MPIRPRVAPVLFPIVVLSTASACVHEFDDLPGVADASVDSDGPVADDTPDPTPGDGSANDGGRRDGGMDHDVQGAPTNAPDGGRTPVSDASVDGSSPGPRQALSGSEKLVSDHYSFTVPASAEATAEPQVYSVPATEGVLSNDVDVDDLTVDSRRLTTAKGASVELLPDGAFSYTPQDNSTFGYDSFEYWLSADPSLSATVWVTLQRGTSGAPEPIPGEALQEGSAPGLVIEGALAGDELGYSVAAAGDVNGDGAPDLIIGAPGRDRNTNDDAGAAYVIFGGTELDPFSVQAAEAGNALGFAILGPREASSIANPSEPHRQGSTVAGIGDINGDGLDDLALSSFSTDPARVRTSGQLWVVLGKRDSAPVDLSSIGNGGGAQTVTLMTGYFLGLNVSGAGDTNGDGFDDLLVAAPTTNDSGKGSGVTLMLGFEDFVTPSLSNIELGTTPGYFIGSQVTRQMGRSMAAGGDVNGDGVDDVLIGSAETRRPYVVYGNRNNELLSVDDVSRTGGGLAIWEEHGASDPDACLASTGDQNGDGLDDLVMGVPDGTDDGGRRGILHLFLSSRLGRETAVEELERTHWAGASAGESFGSSVATGDVDGDGMQDVVVGAPGAGVDGEVIVLTNIAAQAPGVTTTSDEIAAGWLLVGDQQSSAFGSSVAVADLNADGLDDVIVGAPRANETGAVYISFSWNGSLERRAVVYGTDASDRLHSATTDLLRVRGGRGVDELILEGAGQTWDLNAWGPATAASLEVIDITGSGDNELLLPERLVRSLPASRRNLPDGLAKVLEVRGDTGDVLRIDLSDFVDVGAWGTSRLFHRDDSYYGLAISDGITIASP